MSIIDPSENRITVLRPRTASLVVPVHLVVVLLLVGKVVIMV